MTWLTLRQFRIQAIAMVGLVLALGVLFAVAGKSGPAPSTLVNSLYYAGNVAIYVLPALLGAFWGAPLVARELEAGTHSLVWNQGITRGQWLATKLAVIGGAAALLAGSAGLAMTWWASAASQEAAGRLLPVVFGARGVAPAGYALFAFCLGVAAGILLRRVLPAMAVTLAVFLAVQLVVPLLVREYLVPTTKESVVITNENMGYVEFVNSDGLGDRLGGGDTFEGMAREIGVDGPAGAWVIDNELVDAAGNATAVPPVLNSCVALRYSPGKSIEEQQACLAKASDAGYRQSMSYHPPGHFWRLQWVELGLFLVLSGGLAWLSFRRIRAMR